MTSAGSKAAETGAAAEGGEGVEGVGVAVTSKDSQLLLSIIPYSAFAL